MNQIVLIVEDDKAMRDGIAKTLQVAGYKTQTASNGIFALQKLNKCAVDLVVSDINMDRMNGHQLLARIQQQYPHIPVILITGNSSVGDAVMAVNHGASDYLPKPFEPALLLEKIKRFLPDLSMTQSAPIAADPKSKHMLALAKRVAQTTATVLISGESGTGKEVLARYIHDHSARAKADFIAINCAAIPEQMLEATLFGYEKGAFTGAYKATAGKFECANGGTLLLDEISEMDLGLQAKLLRVLQEQEVERIGGNKTIPLDVRIIATTNRDMPEMIAAKQFRDDLFYRLNVFPLHWIPLRERPEDIVPLAKYVLQRHAKQQKNAVRALTPDAIEALQNYCWPGNAREMDNVIQRAMIMAQGCAIGAEDLLLEMSTRLGVSS